MPGKVPEPIPEEGPIDAVSNPAAMDEPMRESFTVFEEEEDSGAPETRQARWCYKKDEGPPPSTRGEFIAATAVPVCMNVWLWSQVIFNEEDTSVIDTAGISHTVAGSRLTINQVLVFLIAWIFCANLITAQMWFTMSVVARRHRLDQAGAVADKGYGARLFDAMQEARMPTQAERANLGMFMVNLFCVVLLAFVESWDEPAIILAAGIGLPIGVAPIVWYMWGVLVTVARSKALEKQRTRSVQFAATAFRGTMVCAALQIVFLMRFAVMAANMPSDPVGALMLDLMCLQDNTDSVSNKTWYFSASLKDCNGHPEYLAGEHDRLFKIFCFLADLRSNGAVFCRHDRWWHSRDRCDGDRNLPAAAQPVGGCLEHPIVPRQHPRLLLRPGPGPPP